jgi:hypothetical protein
VSLSSSFSLPTFATRNAHHLPPVVFVGLYKAWAVKACFMALGRFTIPFDNHCWCLVV